MHFMDVMNAKSRDRLRDQWPRLQDDFERKFLKQSSIPRSMSISRFHHTSKQHHALQSEDAHAQEPLQNLRCASSLDHKRQSRTKPTLTSLPLSLQARILRHLLGEGWTRRSTLSGTNCFLPSRGPGPNISLDGADIAHSILPSELLAPALASPILAAAAQTLLSSACSYLTDINTEMQLPLWVTAFAEHVRAVSVKGIHDGWFAEQRSTESKRILVDNSCEQAVQLFKALSINAVRLQVLDLVHVPFHTSGCMQDALLSGLCTTLESNRATLTQLALPIYPYSDLVPRALETATLPHLTVLSMEATTEATTALKGDSDLHDIYTRQFLRMMQAVDGHADRSRHLTTLKELRLINFDVVPCTEITEYGCSTGFFHTVRTLRVSMSTLYVSIVHLHFASRLFSGVCSSSIVDFFVLFRKLESLHWNGTMTKFPTDLFFEKVCPTLKEVHLCYPDWITGAQVGSAYFRGFDRMPRHYLRTYLELSNGKMKTLVISRFLSPARLLNISKSCPNLEYLSLIITRRIVHKLHILIEACQRLTGLEVVIEEHADERLGEDGWRQLGKAIPRSHPKLSEIAVQTRGHFHDIQAPIKVVIDCFTEIVKRAGRRAQRLVFRARLKSRAWSRIWDAICRVLDTCTDHSWLLRHLVVELSPRYRHRIAEDFGILLGLHQRLRHSRDKAVDSLPYLNKLDLGLMHVWSNDIVASPSRQKLG